MSLLGKLFGMKSVNYQQLVKEGAVIVDVRSPGEFQGGHIKGSMVHWVKSRRTKR